MWSNVNRGAEAGFTTLQFASAFSCLVFFDCGSCYQRNNCFYAEYIEVLMN